MKMAFIVIGNTQSGSTSLYHYLKQHPDIFLGVKEPNLFLIDKGCEQFHDLCARTDRKIFGEVSPIYFRFKAIPEKIKECVPDAKLLLLLRNPVDRAYSDYWAWKNRPGVLINKYKQKFIDMKPKSEYVYSEETNRRGFHHLSFHMTKDSFEEAIDRGFLEQPIHHYYENLRWWNNHFDLSQFLIIKSEDLLENRDETLSDIFSNLELPFQKIDTSQKHMVGKYPEMNPETRKHLLDYFREENQQLYDLVGRDFKWD